MGGVARQVSRIGARVGRRTWTPTDKEFWTHTDLPAPTVGKSGQLVKQPLRIRENLYFNHWTVPVTWKSPYNSVSSFTKGYRKLNNDKMASFSVEEYNKLMNKNLQPVRPLKQVQRLAGTVYYITLEAADLGLGGEKKMFQAHASARPVRHLYMFRPYPHHPSDPDIYYAESLFPPS